ncbi:amino acid ABC transporter permease protein [Butyrivibrio proteoclasticus B316]|jgi:polar amino acid transport system permease protein|uniref:Amino acid ABC transporter permease protein n=1 Tax=Butyrivibrio proteoclasticus (strain ATCC 51982 / DSM 14932 / B316) TaxID=515622 RepID=E0RVP0_BUTPB|nr:amino acid ABC transporter permease [Butyrivibrio proteoclasticus]ADL35198.1 amino acid ABC transporter permease protein [Butyrivibrio proteoclasticus B316]
MDIEVIKTYLPLYNEAILLTIRIGWLGILAAFVIGLLGAAVLYFRVPVLKKIIAAYIEVFRNTPLLVQLFFIYFALPKIGIRISAEICGILGLGLIGGAYMIETIRSGLESVDRIQSESALSLGMTKGQVFFHIVLPQAFSISIPGFVANVIFLLKETSVFSTISLMDLMFTAKDLIGMYAKTIECLFLLVVYYLIMLLPVSILGTVVERRARYAQFGD